MENSKMNKIVLWLGISILMVGLAVAQPGPGWGGGFQQDPCAELSLEECEAALYCDWDDEIGECLEDFVNLI